MQHYQQVLVIGRAMSSIPPDIRPVIRKVTDRNAATSMNLYSVSKSIFPCQAGSRIREPEGLAKK